MKIESQLLEDHQIKLKVEIEPGPFEDAKRRAAREIAKRAKIPGFRPGKAPYHVVERFAGQQAILADAMDLLVKDFYPKMIEESGIKPYGPGSLENIPSTDPPVFEFVVPLEAEVTLGDYRQVRLPYEPKATTDEDVNQVLENMRAQQAVIEPVERPAQEGDLVTVKLNAERKQVEEGEEPTLIRERSYPLIVQAEKPAKEDAAEPVEEAEDESESEAAAEWPFPGFSRNLIGLSAGDERTLTYSYPEDSSFEILRGKEADFHFVVESVKSRTLPEVDDELAHSQGEYENLEALRSDIHTRLQEQMSAEYQNDYNDKIIQEVVSQSTVKYPPQMLEEEIHSLIHRLEDRLQQQKMDLETYLKTRQMDHKALEEELRPSAESRLKQFLVLYEIARVENVQIDEAEVMSQATQTIEQLSKSVSPEQARKSFTPNFLDSMTRSITADLLLRNTVNRLHAIATGEGEAEATTEAVPSGEAASAETTAEAADEQAAAKQEEEEVSSPDTQAVVSTATDSDTEPVEVVQTGESGPSEADRAPAEKTKE